MTDHFHCPRHSIAPKPRDEQPKDTGLCDFCWDEYCFCWSEYCLKQWFEAKGDNEEDKRRTKKDRESK